MEDWNPSVETSQTVPVEKREAGLAASLCSELLPCPLCADPRCTGLHETVAVSLAESLAYWRKRAEAAESRETQDPIAAAHEITLIVQNDDISAVETWLTKTHPELVASSGRTAWGELLHQLGR